MRHRLLPVLAATALLAGPAFAAEPTPAGPMTSATPKIFTSVFWWNNYDTVQELGLTEPQREKMNALAKQGVEKQRDTQTKLQAARTEVDEALKKGKTEDAKSAAARVRTLAGDLIDIQTNFKIEVWSNVLDAKQRDTILAKRPHLLKQPWVRGANLGPGGRGPGGRGPRGKRPKPQEGDG
jgi:Spy/CpxP family protein refolding chaperone